ncbi:hypothetical protein GCM10008107_22730 [Psychrosphaera saromensis]|uniref:Sensory/regulatory protein RpfC n=1 Tax=Psychrosphaera saromensis TaxID=716813 RepID=A0A2S7URF5_9GAMM|nr:response regulator [Psychrosphaera saromensis]PQJ52319.1 hybrid sensor histidine kinase/response regulator [Psychrosphaera saromensis]GHB72770.1 hypothetical protein GCM10008107_22730 [Psychrosphaera saromensis]GLQ13523.1 hypothetical protein GCM10007917_09780 [Psychrosphaera saromensis]
MKIYVVILFCIFQLFSPNIQASTEQSFIPEKATQILFINSLNQDMPWQKTIESGLRNELTEQASSFDLFVENMDTGRFDQAQQKSVMKLYLQEKYREKKVDIIISLGVSAAALLSELEPFFTEIPKIYLRPGSKFTVPDKDVGITIRPRLNYKKATQDAVDLINPQKIILILDTKSDLDLSFYRRIMPIINDDFSHLAVEKWLDIPTEELIEKVNNAPSDAIILFMPIFRSYNDNILNPYQFLQLITSKSPAPIFSYWHSLFGSGIVGGYLLSGEIIGKKAADSIIYFHDYKSLKVVNSEELSSYYYDWRQLDKFAIAHEKLPTDSVISYYVPSYFEKNHTLIYSAIAVIAMLTGFLAFVLFSNNKRAQLLKELDNEKLKLESRVIERTEELLIAKEEAEHLTSVKSDFLANMSHEIRTPMNGVIGLTNILLNSDLPEKQKQYLDKIKYSSDQLLIVINDILDFSKIESGNINLEDFPFSIHSIVDYIKTTFESQAEEKGIEFVINVTDNVNPDLIGDVVRINQVLLNLCSNAIKFTPHGKVSISIQTEPTINEHEEVIMHFIVKDSGIGIAPKNVPHLFEAFTQEDSSTTRKFGGTGLGLTISKRLCKLMGGDISVSSTLNVGSVFTASIKLKLHTQVLTPNCQNLVFPDVFDVLVVDDNTLALNAIEKQLSLMGLSCTLCTSGQQALDLIKKRQDKFKVIITDWSMPIMNGESFLTHIKNMDSKPCDIIIVLTAYSKSAINDLANKLNINTVLEKPVLTSLLYSVIQTNIENSVTLALPNNGESLDGLKVLVAEDNVINQLVITKMLEKEGIVFQLVDNGFDCTQAIENEDFDLILMDIHMPVMDGVEASKIIRNSTNEKVANIPIIALTANVMSDDIQYYLSIGINAHIAKPTQPKDLHNTIVECLKDCSDYFDKIA